MCMHIKVNTHMHYQSHSPFSLIIIALLCFVCSAVTMLSVLLCCAAILAVSSALPTGAPAVTCDNLMPGNPPHGLVEQAISNPWIVDITDFDFNDTINMFTYTPGGIYNGKSVVLGESSF